VLSLSRIKLFLIAVLLILSVSGTADAFSSSYNQQDSISLCKLTSSGNGPGNKQPDYWEEMESHPDKSCHLTQIPEIPLPAANDSRIRIVSRMKLQVVVFKKVYTSFITIYQNCIVDQKNLSSLLNILQI